ncbi:MAG: DUF853 family protein [Phycisphaerae bacterium]|nr:DUF853 family protein [Phycisphaerae bacterium]
MSLRLGKCGSRWFELPDEAATDTISILGKRGAGKTYIAGVLAEEMLAAKQHVVILDPLDVWWGLRASADGKREGYPVVVFGGDRQDVPVTGADGRQIADAIIDHRINAVLSVGHLSKTAQRQFVADFAERLYQKNRDALHLMIDEADAFCPQRVQASSARCMGAVDDLVRRGRARGIGVTLITQRSAAINKDVLTQTECLVCVRTKGPQDKDAVRAWVDVHDAPEHVRDFWESLPTLPTGEAWFWSGDTFARVAIRTKRTFDSSSTPKLGRKRAEPKHWSPVDLEKLRGQLSQSIQAAEASDPAKLRKRIAALEAELRCRPETSAPDESALTAAEAAGYRRGFDAGRKTATVAIRSVLDGVMAELARAAAPEVPPVRNGPAARHRPRSRPATPTTAPDAAPSSRAHENGRLGGGKQRMLSALAQFGAMSDRKMSLLTGLSASSGTFGTYLGQLRAEGLIEGSRGELRATNAGITTLGEFEPLPTGPALRAYWQQRLGQSGIRRLFDVVCEAYPASLAREEAAERAGLSAASGTFGTYLGKLRTLELVSKSGDLRASDELFE